MRIVTMIFLAVWLVVFPKLSFAISGDRVDHRQVVIAVKGMMCESCGKELEKVLKKLPGVGAAVVDVANDRAMVTYDERQINPRQMVEAIHKAGYQAQLPTGQKSSAAARP